MRITRSWAWATCLLVGCATSDPESNGGPHPADARTASEAAIVTDSSTPSDSTADETDGASSDSTVVDSGAPEDSESFDTSFIDTSWLDGFDVYAWDSPWGDAAKTACNRQSDCTGGLKCSGPGNCDGSLCFACRSSTGKTASDGLCGDFTECATGVCSGITKHCSAACSLADTKDADCTAAMGPGFICVDQSANAEGVSGTLGFCVRECARNGDCTGSGDACQVTYSAMLDRAKFVCTQPSPIAKPVGSICLAGNQCESHLCETFKVGGVDKKYCSAPCKTAADCGGSTKTCAPLDVDVAGTVVTIQACQP